MAIDSLPSLRRHLKWAMEVEHATIPPYLCALYSIPSGSNAEAATLLRSVVMEEMLHLTLAANVLNAVGGTPHVDHKSFVPRFPGPLPHSDDRFKVELLPLSEKAVDIFLRIEKPSPPGAKPQGNRFATIGQFYEAVEQALKDLTNELGEAKVFSGKASLQVPPGMWYYGGGGDVIVVHDLESALHALHEITEQGEGFDHTIVDGDAQFNDVDELAHYFRFEELRRGRRFLATDSPQTGPTGDELPMDWSAVLPMYPNPRTRDYLAHPTIHRQMVKFNRIYTRLLRQLQRAFTGTPDALRDGAAIMYELRYQAEALMRIPSPLHRGRTIGPPFEFDPGEGEP